MDWAEFTSLLANNAVVNLNSDLIPPVGTIVEVPYNNVRIVGNGRILANAPWAIRHTGIKLVIEGIDVWNYAGGGIVADGSIRLFMRTTQFNTKGNGLWLKNGAGAWATDTHFNAFDPDAEARLTNPSIPPRPPSIGILTGKWDTFNGGGILTEEHNNCFRFAHGGESANFHIASIHGDRCTGNGGIIEPSAGGGKATNIKFGLLWLAGQGGGVSPLNAHNFDGPIHGCAIQHLHATDFVNKHVTLQNYGAAGSLGLRILDQEHH